MVNNVLQKLIDGNLRFISGKAEHPNQSMERLEETAGNPKPFAIILSCSDSRVPTEIVFDAGVGDLFVIRNAGNILTEEALGSIEYAVEYFSVRLIVVMGHSNCGAVSATVQGGKFPGHINSLTKAIYPAVEKAKSLTGDLITNSVNENVKMVIEKLKSTSPVIEKYYSDGSLVITGAYYIMDSGKVEFN